MTAPMAAAQSPNAPLQPSRTPERRRVFLADLHLDDTEAPRFARFVECLQIEAAWADELFVLGDLFDAWLGDDDDSELANQVCAALRQAAAATKLRFMPGNRDFLCGAGFAERSGATLVKDPFLTEDGLILTHGDALCTDDAAYQRLRQEMRNPQWQKDLLARPLAERRSIARGLRLASATSKAGKAEAIMDVNPEAVDKLLKELDATTLIHGHTHRPGVHRNAATTRYVLGDWTHCGWLLRQTGPNLHLERFSLTLPYA